jgi:predicted Zn finger-like uncharacterized protein
MIVQCEKCETRFHVADTRIPEKGARVRCSRCHHRFHITPSSGTPGGASADGDVSVPDGAASPAGEDELDNPEFLFEGETSQQSTRKPTQKPKPAAAQPSAAQHPEAKPAEAKPAAKPAKPKGPEPEGESTADPGATHRPLEERVVETMGKTAQEMLDAGAPKLGQSPPVEFASGMGTDDDDTRSRFFLGDEPPTPKPGAAEAKSAAKPAPKAAAKPALKVAAKAAAVAKPAAKPTPSELDLALGAGLGEEDDADTGWESLTANEASESAPARDVFDAAASFGIDTKKAAPALDAKAPAPAAVAKVVAKKRQAPDMPEFDPEAAGIATTVARIAAVLVGMLLLGGAARGLLLQSEAYDSSLESLRAAGWTAADIETFAARDARGERVLVVRGNLFPDGAAPPPEVEVSLLERDGHPVGEPRRAWLERLDDAEVAPDRISLRLASSGTEVGAAGPRVTGFTAFLPDPPASARRVHVALSAGPQLPRGTAGAVTPDPAHGTPPGGQPLTADQPQSPPANGANETLPESLPAAPAPEE